jgi:hypothetical protein
MVASLDWATYARTVPAIVGVTDQESAVRLSEMILKSSSKEFYGAVWSATSTPRADTSRVTPEPLETPILAIHHRGSTAPEGMVRDFVADQPNAQLILPATAWPAITTSGRNRNLRGGRRSATRTLQPTSPIRTILFTDLVDHTAMMQRLGDAKGR